MFLNQCRHLKARVKKLVFQTYVCADLMCLQWLWVCPAHNCCPIFGCSVKQFKSHIEVSHTVCADFNLAASRQNQVLSRPSVCRPLTWLLIVITQTTSNCRGSRTSLAERSEPCAFLFPQPATWQPGDVCKTKKKGKKSLVVINNIQIALIPVCLKPEHTLVPGRTINVFAASLASHAETTPQRKGCCCLFMHIKMCHCSQYIFCNSLAAEYLININII